MSEKVSVDQYGRKTWDVEAYANEAKGPRGKNQKNNNDDETHDNKKINNELGMIQHREKLLNELVDAVKDRSIISAGVGDSSKVSRRELFGFSCPVCQIAFRDTMALVDHLNSPQHIEKVTGSSGESLKVKSATIDEVKAMLSTLAAKKAAKDQPKEGFVERVRRREEFDRNRKAMVKKRKLKQRERKKQRTDDGDAVDDEFASMMGFTAFGTTKR